MSASLKKKNISYSVAVRCLASVTTMKSQMIILQILDWAEEEFGYSCEKYLKLKQNSFIGLAA